MFSGIIEAKSKVLEFKPLDPEYPQNLVRIQVAKPTTFNDIKTGDSIAVNGICLTVEKFNDEWVQFALGHETLKIANWNEKTLSACELNLERSLRIGDRVHGHFVTGHVDGRAEVMKSYDQGGSWMLDIKIPANIAAFVWPKGSLALNGVSLTINSIEKDILGFCLIPETVQRTNLASLKPGDSILVEADQMARALVRRETLNELN
ncbi:MAG: riboflavin synthase [Bdellovibrionota bacterium]